MEFQCRLGTLAGEVLEGVYVAEDETKLRRQLEEKGLYVLSLRPRGLLSGAALSLPRRRRISTREFIVFNQELATLIKAGMPLVQSLDILRQRSENPMLKSILDDVYGARAGRHSIVIGVRGTRQPVSRRLHRLAHGGRSRVGISKRSCGGTWHTPESSAACAGGPSRRSSNPAILLGLSLVVVAIIVLRVTPEFASFYASLGADLPVITKLILALSEFVGQYALGIVMALVAAGVLGWMWFKQPGRSALIDRWLLSSAGARSRSSASLLRPNWLGPSRSC